MSHAFTRRYRLLDRIAVGGTAEVFRALSIADSGIESPVVIKRVLPQMAGDERFRKLFAEEARLAATLSHPNVVRVLDHGDLGDTCYIALERIDGQDLGSLLDAAHRPATGLPVPAPLAAMIANEVAEALQFIHHHTSAEGLPLRIIHRDVSPQNILVSYGGDVKLTDFGIAKSVIRREHTVDGTLRGKLRYMAPEQANSTDEVDHRADLFALGCVLYEMLAGHSPLGGASDIETLDRVRACRFTVPPDRIGAPLALRKVLERLLQADRDKRYGTAAELVADLRSYLICCDPAPSRGSLADWVQRWGNQAVQGVGNSAVDLAVRALLGEAPDEADDLELTSSDGQAVPTEDRAGQAQAAAPNSHLSSSQGPQKQRKGATSVFASPLESDATHERTAEVEIASDTPLPHGSRNDTPVDGNRRTLRIVIPLAAFALLGWGLLALNLHGPQAPMSKPVQRASPRDPAPQHPGKAPGVRLGPPRWVQSEPAGASIRIDGKPKGATPSLLRLPRRPFVLGLHKRGYRVYRRRLRASDATGGLAIRLLPTATPRPDRQAKRATGYLTVNSLPWSRVFMDGRFLGNTPLVRREVSAGRRRIQLRGPSGGPRKSFVATVRAGRTGTYTFDFRAPGDPGGRDGAAPSR